VNGDGLLDVVCHFYTQETVFHDGDTNGVLKGFTTGGVAIQGTGTQLDLSPAMKKAIEQTTRKTTRRTTSQATGKASRETSN
jgi:hypothetical protein